MTLDLEAENKKLRELLWLRHGCDGRQLYGDDGEMQCVGYGLDFKRMSAAYIEQSFMDLNKKKLEAFLKTDEGKRWAMQLAASGFKAFGE